MYCISKMARTTCFVVNRNVSCFLFDVLKLECSNISAFFCISSTNLNTSAYFFKESCLFCSVCNVFYMHIWKPFLYLIVLILYKSHSKCICLWWLPNSILLFLDREKLSFFLIFLRARISKSELFGQFACRIDNDLTFFVKPIRWWCEQC